MTIESVTYSDSNHTSFVVVQNGITMHVPDDMGNSDRRAIDEWVNKGNTIADFVAPPPAPVTTISDRQFFQELAIMGLITQSEAMAAVGTGAIPQAMMNVINTLPTNQQFSAKMLLTGAREFNINDPLVQIFAAAQKPPMTQTDLENLWLYASKL